MEEVDTVRYVVPAPVDIGDRERPRADVGSEYGSAGQPAGDGNGYGPTASTDVGDRQIAGWPMVGVLEDLRDEQLGLLAGDEHTLIYREVQAAEFSVSNDVGQWLAVQPAAYQLVYRRKKGGVEHVVESSEEPGPVKFEDVPEDAFGLDLR